MRSLFAMDAIYGLLTFRIWIWALLSSCMNCVANSTQWRNPGIEPDAPRMRGGRTTTTLSRSPKYMRQFFLIVRKCFYLWPESFTATITRVPLGKLLMNWISEVPVLLLSLVSKLFAPTSSPVVWLTATMLWPGLSGQYSWLLTWWNERGQLDMANEQRKRK